MRPVQGIYFDNLYKGEFGGGVKSGFWSLSTWGQEGASPLQRLDTGSYLSLGPQFSPSGKRG